LTDFQLAFIIMYVRVKKAPKSNNKVVILVESYRDDMGKPKQMLIKHIGTAKNEQEVEQLKEKALALKQQLTQQRLAEKEHNITPSTFGSKFGETKKIRKGISFNPLQLSEAGRYILGIHDVYGYIYKLLNFTNPFYWPKRREHASKILREVVLARIANPCSKRATVDMLETKFGVPLKLDHVYQMMDKIDDAFCNRIQERALTATLQLTGKKIKVLFYDATTLYFESFTEDDLKQNGYSKDMKFNQPQILLALFVTQDGLPVGYEVFPGATYEGHTLKPVLEKLKKRYQIDEMVFVADRGMLSVDNINYLEESNIPYIVGARIKNTKETTKKDILAWGKQARESDKNNATHHINITKSKRLILSYKKKRAYKDQKDREKAIAKLHKKLSKSKNPQSLISNYGYKKFLKMEGSATIAVNHEKIEKESVWDGLIGLYTNHTTLTDTEVLTHYRSLWQVEESFRITKHDLKIRPIYHWTPKRIQAHIAISFMAFACVRHLEYRVKLHYKKLSPEAIRQVLLDVQASVIENKETKKRYLLPSKARADAKQIYQVLGIKIPTHMQAIV